MQTADPEVSKSGVFSLCGSLLEHQQQLVTSVFLSAGRQAVWGSQRKAALQVLRSMDQVCFLSSVWNIST